MKKLILFAGLSVIIISFLNSCSSIKRRYSPGYTIVWNSVKKDNHSKKQKSNKVIKEESITDARATKKSVTTIPTLKSKNYEALENTNNTFASLDDNPVVYSGSTSTMSNIINTDAKSLLINPTNFETKSIEKKQSGKIFKSKKLVNASIDSMSGKSNDDNKILCIILSFFIPPLAVYLWEGKWNQKCTINLILTLLCGIPGVIHSLIVILGS